MRRLLPIVGGLAMLAGCGGGMQSVSTVPNPTPILAHWVSPTGAAAWGSCVDASPLSETSACSLATANANAVTGDLVYLRGGTYNITTNFTAIFSPTNSGTSASQMITFQAYTGETPTFTQTAGLTVYAVFFDTGTQYISVKGMTFVDIADAGRIRNGANHNEIAFNTYRAVTLSGFSKMHIGNENGPGATVGWATHNWIHDNHFTIDPGDKGCTDGGDDWINVGEAYSGIENVNDNNYNTVENNFFEHVQHTVLDFYGKFGVIRNNISHNEPWSSGCDTTNIWPPTYSSSNPSYSAYNGMYGHRNFQLTDDYQRTGLFDLFEGNRLGFAGMNQNNGGADNFDLAAPQNIVRYNFLYGAMNTGLEFKYGWGYAPGSGGNGGTYNRVYNNTIYNSGYGYPLGLTYISGNNSGPLDQTNVGFYDPANDIGNVFKNNLLYAPGVGGYAAWGTDVLAGAIGGTSAPFGITSGWGTFATLSTNWCSGAQTASPTPPAGACAGNTNPLFVNPDLSTVSSKTLPDLSLQSVSPVIDGGTYLTTTTDSGNKSTNLTVADALYFQDGTWGSDLARASAGLGGTFQADWIAIGTVTNIVRISSVIYGTYDAPAGTITLASPMTWSNGAHIWLYKKSDGTRILYGSAPDYGASEYSSGGGKPLP